jgi:hypothetical protein
MWWLTTKELWLHTEVKRFGIFCSYGAQGAPSTLEQVRSGLITASTYAADQPGE